MTIVPDQSNRAEFNKIVSQPGKFEGEAAYVPYFWDQMLSGGADEDVWVDDVCVSRFDVTDEDLAIFPELEGRASVWLYERSDGFVCECDEPDPQEDDEDSTDDEDSEPTEPDDEDWATEDHVTFREVGGRGTIVVPDGQDWRNVVKARMEADQYWPNVWLISDHGNAHLLDLTNDDDEPALDDLDVDSLDEFTSAYVECALWSSHEYSEDGTTGPALNEDYSAEDIAPETLRQIVTDCLAFQRDHAADIADDLSRAGHDFWLTRNRHGAGFWDGDYPDEVGRRLTDAAHVYGSVDLYVGDDGKIHGN